MWRDKDFVGVHVSQPANEFVLTGPVPRRCRGVNELPIFPCFGTSLRQPVVIAYSIIAHECEMSKNYICQKQILLT